VTTERLTILRAEFTPEELVAIFAEQTGGWQLKMETNHLMQPTLLVESYDWTDPNAVPDDVVSDVIAEEVYQGEDGKSVVLEVDLVQFIDMIGDYMSEKGAFSEPPSFDRARWIAICDETQTVIEKWGLEVQWRVS
jgi:hypothetical protein